MKLVELLSVLDPEGETKSSSVSSSAATEVFGLTDKSSEVQPGWVFVAIRGTKMDGHHFLDIAVKNGAVALIVEDSQDVPPEYAGETVKVLNTRVALDYLADRFYGSPSLQLFCVGVTGTNGKTSITYMMEHLLNSCQIPTGVMGTINHHFLERVWPSDMTTPGAIALQRRLREMKNSGAKAVAMEVSSHALEQCRADAVQFNTVIFTNLTRDHLDYHKTLKGYFRAKQRLFTDLLWSSDKVPMSAVVNIDDEWGRKLRVAAKAFLLTYGQGPSDFQYKIIKSEFSHTDFELHTPFGKSIGQIPMCGAHNIANCVAVIAAGAASGISVSKSLEIMAKFPGVPGRLQRLPNSKCFNVFIDYAHTPDALKNVLLSLRRVRAENKTQGRIWTIFGCGGDRDKGKRPIMANIASQLSDFVMVTSDNPREENPLEIIDQILKGVPKEKKEVVFSEGDRARSFQQVFSKAKAHDIILIAGKGHEDYQIVGQEKLVFDDYAQAKELLK